MAARDKVLIIDDHKEFREMLRSFIQKQFKDVEIREASSGEEGVKLAIKENPRVSLIDIRLPGMDGIETSRQIKRWVPGCFIITMSMFKDSAKEFLIPEAEAFVGKDEIDSGLLPCLYRLLDGKGIKKGAR